MSKKVLFSTTVPQSANNFLRGQLGFLRENGIQPVVVSSPGPALEELHQRERVAICPLPMAREISLGKDLVSLWRWIKLLRRLRPHAVAVGTPKAALLALTSSTLRRIPERTYIVHGLRYESEQGAKRRLLIAMERVSCRLATSIVVVSHSVGVKLHADAITRKPFTLIASGTANGIDTQRWSTSMSHNESVSIRTELGITESSFVAIYVGRLTADKGLETLREFAKIASEHIPDFKLLVVGATESREELAALEALGDVVILTGEVRDVAPYYAASDCLVLPSRREGFGMVVLEAAMAGVPTIASRVTGLVDAVVDGETGFLLPQGDPAAFANKAVELSLDRKLLRSLGENARKRAISEFASKRVWGGMLKHYLHPGVESDEVRIYPSA